MIVVADTSPISYLALIGQADLLRTLFGEVQVPPAVLSELSHPGAPPEVQRLLHPLPDWIRETAVPDTLAGLENLDPGERQALQLACALGADLVLIDESRGRMAAEKLGLAVVGTIGILERAASKGLLDGAAAAARLGATTFRASPKLLARLHVPKP